MAASSKQRFSLYLLTLLFIWVNAFAAPYQCIRHTSTHDTAQQVVTVSDVSPTAQTEINDTDEPQFQQPLASGELGVHSAFPAEETFEEQEESHRKDEESLAYLYLPDYLALTQLADIFHPRYLSHHQLDLHEAVRKQSTYLLDCTFLI